MTNLPAGNGTFPAPMSTGATKKPAKRRTGLIIAISVAAAMVFLLLAGVGGFFLYTNIQYEKANEYIRTQDYAQAGKLLSGLASFYQDVKPLQAYSKAGSMLLSGQYAEAKALFQSLGEFRDAKTMVQESDYLLAGSMLADGKFSEAKALYQALPGYKNSATQVQEADYLLAQSLLQEGDLADAKAMFLALGAYKDADAMVQEADYRQADALLESGDFDGAYTLFQALSANGYRDAGVLLQQTDYLHADSLITSKQYEAALIVLERIKDYKDSAEKLKDTSVLLLEEAIKCYIAADYPAAAQRFNSVAAYQEDAARFLLLIEAHSITLEDSRTDYEKTKAIYNQVKTLGNYADAPELLTSNFFLPYRLEGKWSTRDGSFTFVVKYDKAKKAWFVDGDRLDTLSMLVDQKYYFLNVFGQWMERLAFSFRSEDECSVVVSNSFDYDDGTILKLIRS